MNIQPAEEYRHGFVKSDIDFEFYHIHIQPLRERWQQRESVRSTPQYPGYGFVQAEDLRDAERFGEEWMQAELSKYWTQRTCDELHITWGDTRRVEVENVVRLRISLEWAYEQSRALAQQYPNYVALLQKKWAWEEAQPGLNRCQALITELELLLADEKNHFLNDVIFFLIADNGVFTIHDDGNPKYQELKGQQQQLERDIQCYSKRIGEINDLSHIQTTHEPIAALLSQTLDKDHYSSIIVPSLEEHARQANTEATRVFNLAHDVADKLTSLFIVGYYHEVWPQDIRLGDTTKLTPVLLSLKKAIDRRRQPPSFTEEQQVLLRQHEELCIKSDYLYECLRAQVKRTSVWGKHES